MPKNDDGSLRAHTAPEIAAMQIGSFGVRTGEHPSEVLKVRGRRMTRKWLVKWEERYNFAELVLGNETLFIEWADSAHTTGTKKLSRLLPDSRYGRHPQFQSIMAVEITEMRGHGAGRDDANGMPAYEKAEISVDYEYHPYSIGSQNDPPTQIELNRYIQLDGSLQGATESFGPLPGGAFKAVNAGGTGASGRAMPYNFSLLQPTERFTLIWRKLPMEVATDVGALCQRLTVGDPADVSSSLGRGQLSYRGTVNSQTLTVGSIGRSFPPGTLLLDDADTDIWDSPFAETDLKGMRAQAKFRYSYRPTGWLNLYVFDGITPTNSGYYLMSNNGNYYTPANMPDNNGLYNCRDHNQLFNVAI